MEIRDNITFTSNINFVSTRQFRKVIRKCGEYIPFADYGEGKFSSFSSTFYTKDIRTCTAGGVKNERKAKGFHIKDSRINFENIKNIFKTVKNDFEDKIDGGLLIGSKKLLFAPNSLPIFKTMKNLLKKETPNISVFETFDDSLSEAHIHYSHPKDTWTINVQLIDREKENYYSVLSKKQLQNAFKNISISPNDKVFINGKEIKLSERG